LDSLGSAMVFLALPWARAPARQTFGGAAASACWSAGQQRHQGAACCGAQEQLWRQARSGKHRTFDSTRLVPPAAQMWIHGLGCLDWPTVAEAACLSAKGLRGSRQCRAQCRCSRSGQGRSSVVQCVPSLLDGYVPPGGWVRVWLFGQMNSIRLPGLAAHAYAMHGAVCPCHPTSCRVRTRGSWWGEPGVGSQVDAALAGTACSTRLAVLAGLHCSGSRAVPCPPSRVQLAPGSWQQLEGRRQRSQQ
jgi:hypothetical protein